MNVIYSLDCERLWGMPKGASSEYIANNVRNSALRLNQIKATWLEGNPDLYLAFVLTSLNEKAGLDKRFYEEKLKERLNVSEIEGLLYFDNDNDNDNDNIRLGVHSLDHTLYIDLDADEELSEVSQIADFLAKNEEYGSLFVYPKNLSTPDSLEKLSKIFGKVRLNSKSWLYKSRKGGVPAVIRVLRYIDSYLPIYELFCDKIAEHQGDNITVGTHFFRANLNGFALKLHLARLKVGIRIMKVLGCDVHIWSHPHNFSEKSVKEFNRLAQWSNRFE